MNLNLYKLSASVMLMELFSMIALRIKHTASGSQLCSLKLPKTEDY
jgi:hypothetical protein